MRVGKLNRWGVLVLCTCQAVALASSGSQTGEERRVFAEAEEFSALRDVSRRVYDESLAFWQERLWQEASERIGRQQDRLDQLVDEGERVIKEYEDLDESEGGQLLRPSSPEKDLLVLSAALEALRHTEKKGPSKENWRAAADLLEPFAKDIRSAGLRADIRVFAALLLSSAWLREEDFDRAGRLLKSVNEAIKEQKAASRSQTPNEALLLLLQGDAAFGGYSYQESYSYYQEAARAAVALASAEIGRLAEVRLYWSAYRSGQLDFALNHLTEICRRDSYRWNRGSVNEKRLFEEALRVAGDVLFRIENDDLRSDFLRRESAGACRSHAAAHWIEKLADNGRFETAVSAFLNHYELASESPSFVDAAAKATAVAGRDRPGFDANTPTEIVLIAAPILEKGGSYQSRFGENQESESKRERYIKQSVLLAANQQYETASRERDVQRYRSAVRLYDIRLREGDVFDGRQIALFRMGQSFAQTDSRAPARDALGQALGLGLDQETAQAARETICELGSRDAIESPTPELTLPWLEDCERLVTAHPSLRSLLLMHTAAEFHLRHDAKRVSQALLSALTLVSTKPDQLASLPADIAQTTASSVASGLSGVEAREAYSRIESLLRPRAPAPVLRVIEQANYSKHVTEFEERKEGGQFVAARQDLEDWIARNPDNIYFPAALFSLLEELYLVREWQPLLKRSRELMALFENRPDLVGLGNESGAQVSIDRIRLLMALALEGTLRFDLARGLFAEIEKGDGESVAAARGILLDRYMGSLDETQKSALWKRAALASGGLSTVGRLEAMESGLAHAVGSGDQASIKEWIEISGAINPANVRDSLYALGILRRLANLGLPSSGQPTESFDEWGYPGLKDARRIDLIRMAATTTVKKRLEIDDTPSGLNFIARLLAALPRECVSPSALVPVLSAALELGSKIEPNTLDSLKSRAVMTLEESAMDEGTASLQSSTEIEDSHRLIEMLVGPLKISPKATDIVSWIGPNRPVFSNAARERISQILADEVSAHARF